MLKFLKRISIQIPFFFVVLSFMAVTCVAIAGYNIGYYLLDKLERKSVTLLAHNKQQSLEDYLSVIEGDLHTMASSKNTLNALEEFKQAWRSLGENQTSYLQQLYITENRFPLGDKHKLDTANDGSLYSSVHEEYHPYFRTYLETKGYYDIFLFDTEGNLVYTVFKENDYATNLLNGPWRDSGLGAVYKRAMQQTNSNEAVFEDFEPYAPSNNVPASFIAKPLFDGQKKVGVLVFQMPIERINGIFSNYDGFGQTQNVFLLGQDFKMRSVSRFHDDAILNVKYQNEGIEKAFSGEPNTGIYQNMEGEDVYQAALPFNYRGGNLAIVSTENFGAVQYPLSSVVMTLILSLLIISAVSYVLARAIVKPINAIKQSIVALSEGDVKATIPYTEQESEVGDMARSLADFREDAVQAMRTKSGMERASANIMMADEDLNIVFMNDSQEKMLRNAEQDLRKELPNFSVDGLVGKNIDQFHSNPSHQRSLLGALENSYSSRIKVAGRTFDLFANPAFSKAGQRIGTTIEWVDRTVELAIADEIKDMIEAASRGSLDNRIQLDGKEDFFLEVSQGINNLAQVMENVAKDLASNLKALASGDLTKRIEADYDGLFKELKDDYNATSSKLADIVGNLKSISADVNTHSYEMAESSSGLADRAEQQASTLEETAASMEELTSTVKTNADNAKSVNQSAAETRAVAERGSQVANDAGHAMEKINESSKKITEIINVIDEIAFQTNLLALNAAVEAARAGDAGRGFAVVAQEVRTLAQRSAQSSKDIKALIDDSSSQVGEGVELVKTAVTSLQQIYDSIDGVADTIGQIATASAEQSTSLDELNQAVMDMDSMTQKNASMAQQSRNVAQIMQERSDSLSQMISYFKIDEHDARSYSGVPMAQADMSTRPANQQSLDAPKPLKQANGAGASAVSNGTGSCSFSSDSSENDADWKEF